MSLQRFRLGGDFDHHICSLRKWILHLHVAAVQTEIADSRGRTSISIFVDDFGQGRKRIPGCVASFGFIGIFPWGKL